MVKTKPQLDQNQSNTTDSLFPEQIEHTERKTPKNEGRREGTRSGIYDNAISDLLKSELPI